MKGVVFTEFLELVEDKFGLTTVDNVMTKGCPFQRGFTSVGTYDYRELLSMVEQLSSETGAPAAVLVKTFGNHLFHTFLKSYPEAFLNTQSTEDLLRQVEDVIHIEVRKLYPDAELPTFKFPQANPNEFTVEYQSSRPFADLAEGLIEASIDHFGESFIVRRTDMDGEPGTHCLFHLQSAQQT
jgi:hypothetical protein